jgi:hypothetical protein
MLLMRNERAGKPAFALGFHSDVVAAVPGCYSSFIC